MLVNKEYRKLYRKYIRKEASNRRKISLWIDRKSERHVQIMAAMFIVGFLLVIAYGYETILSWSKISQIYFGFAVVFGLMPANWLPFIYRIRKELKVLLGICALAPFFTGLVLMFNYHIPIVKYQQTFKVVQYKCEYENNLIMVELDNEKMNNHFEIRKFPMNECKHKPDSAVYLLQKGCFGLTVVKNSWLIPQ